MSIEASNRRRYIRQHWRVIAAGLTPRRVVNLALNQAEYRLRRVRLRSLPPYLKIEPSVRCQLACPGCAQSGPTFKDDLAKKKGFLSLDEFKTILDPGPGYFSVHIEGAREENGHG